MSRQRSGRAVAANLLVLVLAVLATPASPAAAETYRLATGAPPNHPWGWGARLWADLVAERSAGRIVFEVVPEAPDGPRAAALDEGRADAVVASALVWAEEVPELGLFGLPCLIDGPGDLDRLVASTVGARLLEAVRIAGAEPLAWGDAGAWAVAARTGPLTRSGQLAGLTLRVPPIASVREAFMVLGVDPLPIALDRALTMSRLGMIDGLLARLADLAAADRPPEGYDTWTVWPCLAEPLLFAVADDVWVGWSIRDRAIVAQAAIEAAIAQAGRARGLVRADAPWLAPAGLTLVRFGSGEAGRLSGELSHIRQRHAQSVGRSLVLQAEQLLLTPR